MSAEDRVTIRKLPTGVPGLDEILGGGLPEYSFNIIAGSPGGGKSTLAHQVVFANATPERPALYFTVLGEPALKMLRYQQQFKFFDPAKLNTAVRFVNLSQVVLEQDLEAVLAEIIKEVEATHPAVVVVDSFRTVVRKAVGGTGEAELQGFIQRLALHLTSWQATTFLIGEYTEGEVRDNPVFTVADGLFWLYQQVERNSIVRKLQVMKLRGQASVPGLHTFRITEDGVQAFPRNFGLTGRTAKARERRRLPCGVPGLDAMLGGGIPEGDSLLVVGPSGAGKSVFASQFIAEGLRLGEPGIVAIFEERPEEYAGRAASLGMDFTQPQRDGKLSIIYLRPLDLSVDEAMREILDVVARTGAKRLVIDSLAGFEMALAPGFRTDFRESLYRMIGAVTRTGVTIVSTVEVTETFTELALSPYSISFLSDDIIRLRYVEIDGQLRKVIMVVKVRAGDHSKDICEYQITSEGLRIGERLTGYHGLTTGVPEPLDLVVPEPEE
ncbi:ATPase domain-containing protein [Frigoriglobus tundricola]|uniref:non-specific serine/threonine protein kinase n=1 Tax=Frigoriglobus tundricola TaxID=2774151 RepID=A0A6M5Z739_9BACT|nr:ATPase domain-containing protein [Frigoriglobus tundricola]QJX01204.1 Circadian clock protein KaiC [Frigoriglobus tundricola]